MANFNKVVLIGRLTRDPESRTFPSGGMVSKFGFAVTNRRKNGQTGQWEDEPMFIDCEAYNRGEFGKLADIVRDRCRKGSQIMVEGRLHLDQWDDKTTGQKRSKHKIVVESLQLLDQRHSDGGHGDGIDDEPTGAPARTSSSVSRGGGSQRGPSSQQRSGFPAGGADDNPIDGNNDDIPF